MLRQDLIDNLSTSGSPGMEVKIEINGLKINEADLEDGDLLDIESIGYNAFAKCVVISAHLLENSADTDDEE